MITPTLLPVSSLHGPQSVLEVIVLNCIRPIRIPELLLVNISFVLIVQLCNKLPEEVVSAGSVGAYTCINVKNLVDLLLSIRVMTDDLH